MKRLLFAILLLIHCATMPAQSIRQLSAKEAHAFLAETNTDTLLLIDGRSDEMYQSGYIKSAINIDAYKEDLEQQLTTVINRKHLFIYCTKSTRSDSIINTLTSMGYKGDIFQISDGITGWKAHEFELFVPEPCEARAPEEENDTDTNAPGDKD